MTIFFDQYWGGGRYAYYVTPDLSYEEGGSWTKKGEDNKWDGKKKYIYIYISSIDICATSYDLHHFKDYCVMRQIDPSKQITRLESVRFRFEVYKAITLTLSLYVCVVVVVFDVSEAIVDIDWHSESDHL